MQVNSFSSKHCARRSVRAKYRKRLRKLVKQYSRALSLQLTEWSSQISAGARRPAMVQKRDRARCAAETAHQRSERLRNWGWGTVPNALLKLLVKDKPLYSAKEGKRNFRGEKNEVAAGERQTGSWKLRERLKITVDKDQPASKVSSWNPTRNNITAEKHQPTPMRSWNPRGERIEISVKVQGVEYNSLCCHNSHCFNSVPFKAKMSCKNSYIGYANMFYLFRKISWLCFTQSVMNVCVLILERCNFMCTYTVVTHPCHIPPLAQARPMMLCIYTIVLYS